MASWIDGIENRCIHSHQRVSALLTMDGADEFFVRMLRAAMEVACGL